MRAKEDEMQCNVCKVVNFHEGEALCFCLRCIQQMNSGSMYEMGLKLKAAEDEVHQLRSALEECGRAGCPTAADVSRITAR